MSALSVAMTVSLAINKIWKHIWSRYVNCEGQEGLCIYAISMSKLHWKILVHLLQIVLWTQFVSVCMPQR
jgi:phosphoheptose isomerase